MSFSAIKLSTLAICGIVVPVVASALEVQGGAGISVDTQEASVQVQNIDSGFTAMADGIEQRYNTLTATSNAQSVAIAQLEADINALKQAIEACACSNGG